MHRVECDCGNVFMAYGEVTCPWCGKRHERPMPKSLPLLTPEEEERINKRVTVAFDLAMRRAESLTNLQAMGTPVKRMPLTDWELAFRIALLAFLGAMLFHLVDWLWS